MPKGVGSLYFGGSFPLWSSSEASSTSLSSTNATKQTVQGRGGARSGAANANSLRSGPLSSGSSRASARTKTPNVSDTAGAGAATGPGRSAEQGSSKSDATPDAILASERGLGTGEPQRPEGAHGPVDPDDGSPGAVAVDKEEAMLCNNYTDADEDEDRILSEIETGILDVFSDSYYNKHLMYGVLELILVRLMPELAQKGIIELWEERLS